MKPAVYNFPEAYHKDGLTPLTIRFRISGTADYVDLTGHSVLMQLRDIGNVKVWEFSTLQSADTPLTVAGDSIIFPLVNSWNAPAGTFSYDLQTTSTSGFVRTWIKGKINILPDVSYA